jgi:hypothetical protein
VAIPVRLFTVVATVAFRGFGARIAIFLALIFGFLLSWALDRMVGVITAPTGAGGVTTHFRVNLDGSVARRVRISTLTARNSN